MRIRRPPVGYKRGREPWDIKGAASRIKYILCRTSWRCLAYQLLVIPFRASAVVAELRGIPAACGFLRNTDSEGRADPGHKPERPEARGALAGRTLTRPEPKACSTERGGRANPGPDNQSGPLILRRGRPSRRGLRRNAAAWAAAGICAGS